MTAVPGAPVEAAWKAAALAIAEHEHRDIDWNDAVVAKVMVAAALPSLREVWEKPIRELANEWEHTAREKDLPGYNAARLRAALSAPAQAAEEVSGE